MTRLKKPSVTGTDWIPRLKKLLPSGVVSDAPITCREHAGDKWFAARAPEAVVRARTRGHVVKTLQFAHRHNIPVTTRGAGYGYVGGCVPVRGGIVLSVMGLNRILEINREDGVAVVEPGVITKELQEQVRARGLFYPPDPASHAHCSIGGNIATNAGGPHCLKYGVTKNYVLGLEVVLADGTVVRLGGRTHKNKTGFNLADLFIGSEGMLGVVTQATLRLIPHPQARACISASYPDMKKAAAGVQAILGGGFLPSALELADEFTLRAAREYLGSDHIPKGKAFLLVELDGSRRGLRAEGADLQRLIRKSGGFDLTEAHGERACEKLWDLRRQFSQSLKATGLKKLNEDIVVPRSRLVDLFAHAHTLQRKTGIPVACFGHAGDGNIHVNLMIRADDPAQVKLSDRALDALFRQVLAWGGAITGEHGIGLAKKPWWSLAADLPVRRLHTLIKKALDPKDLFNPGKFV
ncbi:MAG: FAD-linked oxidase C-terminal domain-containing protein [Verrucomicrobiae bacterium]|nr:FAD-linked oxidase C-terminal domain-containing protein [Verrucomicrobiae bacterium]